MAIPLSGGVPVQINPSPRTQIQPQIIVTYGSLSTFSFLLVLETCPCRSSSGIHRATSELTVTGRLLVCCADDKAGDQKTNPGTCSNVKND